MVATRRAINEVFSDPTAAAKDGIIGGRITRLIDGDGETISTGAARTKLSGAKQAVLKTGELAAERKPVYAEVQLPNGQYQVLSSTPGLTDFLYSGQRNAS